MNPKIASGATLLDAIKEKLNLKNDRALCLHFGFTAPAVSKVRSETIRFPLPWLVVVHEETGIDTKELKKIAGFPC